MEVTCTAMQWLQSSCVMHDSLALSKALQNSWIPTGYINDQVPMIKRQPGMSGCRNKIREAPSW